MKNRGGKAPENTLVRQEPRASYQGEVTLLVRRVALAHVSRAGGSTEEEESMQGPASAVQSGLQLDLEIEQRTRIRLKVWNAANCELKEKEVGQSKREENSAVGRGRAGVTCAARGEVPHAPLSRASEQRTGTRVSRSTSIWQPGTGLDSARGSCRE